MTEQVLVPALSIVPLVGLHDDGGCGPFLGTAFFAGDSHSLITCNHVLSAWEGAYGISTQDDKQKLYKAHPQIRDIEKDLAVLTVNDYDPPTALPLEDSEIVLNRLVNCFEYGTTEVAGGHITFSPANRLGNVTRILDMTDMYQAAGDHMLELSFPAMRGASGAPVMTWEPPFKVWGVITANVARELVPAQIERIHDEAGRVTEETRFYLPQALAINVLHVKTLLQQL